jgi:hypothetical protein
MQRRVLLLFVFIHSVAFANHCSTFQVFSPLSYELSFIIISDFVSYASTSNEIWNTAQGYIEQEPWKSVVERWIAEDSARLVLSHHATLVDTYLRTALLDCYETRLEGDLYSPPWHMRLLYGLLLDNGCACFGELTENMFDEE